MKFLLIVILKENFLLKRDKILLIYSTFGANMNKTFLVSVIGMLSFGFVFLTGCSGAKPLTKIKTVDFKGVTQSMKGEKPVLKWNFENADKVKINGIQRNYNPVDSISVSADTTKIYNFIVIKENDTLNLVWRVFVDQPASGIETGKLTDIINQTKPSYINSNFLRGVQSNKSTTDVKALKIMRHYYPFESKNSIRAKALVLDEFGNYISGFGTKGTGFIELNGTTGCTGNIKNSPVTGFREFTAEDDSNGVDFALVLDNSSIAGDYFPIYEQIKTFLKGYSQDDRFALYNFNQNFKETISLKSSKEISDSEITGVKSGGLSAIFKSLKYSIEHLTTESDGRKKVIVLVAYSTDNASIIYDRNDIIDLAISRDIPVYVIGVGNAVDSYSLSSVANLTGAKYYDVDENELDNISLIFNEIIFAQKSGYQFDVPVSADQTGGCTIINANIEFVTVTSRCYDTLAFPTVRGRHEFNYMAVASFEFRDTVVSDEYLESAEILAGVLIQNPDLSVELIGNASIEGNDKFNYHLGLKRAQSVRKLLIQQGADPSKIRVRSDGSNNPVYYLQESQWMQYYNRRVEMRWLDPSLLPYEIVAQISETETDALGNVEKWEDLGYRSYYERYLQNNFPVYRVKIWGFSTTKDAEKTAKKLSGDYGVPFFVQ